MIGKAAVMILQWCVGLEGHPNTGGVAQNIGTYPHRRAPTDRRMFLSQVSGRRCATFKHRKGYQTLHLSLKSPLELLETLPNPC